MKLPPFVQNVVQLIIMTVLAFIFGALILLGASYFDDRPQEASVFFLVVGCLAALNWGWKRWKSQKQGETPASQLEE